MKAQIFKVSNIKKLGLSECFSYYVADRGWYVPGVLAQCRASILEPQTSKPIISADVWNSASIEPNICIKYVILRSGKPIVFRFKRVCHEICKAFWEERITLIVYQIKVHITRESPSTLQWSSRAEIDHMKRKEGLHLLQESNRYNVHC